MMKCVSKAMSLAAIIAFVTGCNPFPRIPPPAVHDFGPARAVETSPPSVFSMEVEAPEWLRDRRIRYRLLYANPTQVRFYADDRWLAPPPDLLAQRLGETLETRGYFLNVRLTAFEQIFPTRDRSEVILRFRVIAQRERTGPSVAEQDFAFTRATPSPDATGAVQAFAAVADEAVHAMRDWLSGLPDSSAPVKK
jgi:cholesterol transport system auxiliary component